jgi:hypothetical protein
MTKAHFHALTALLLCCAVLAGCSSVQPAPDAEPSALPSPAASTAELTPEPSASPTNSPSTAAPPEPSPTPEPTPEPEPTPAPTSWVLTDESPEEILALGQIPSLEHIDARACREYEALLALRELLPDCEIDWVYTLQGQDYPSDTEELTLRSTEGLEEAMACLPALRFVDLTGCQPDMAQMERLYERYPQVEFLWYVHFGREGLREWTVRSDITVFSTLWTGQETTRYTEEDYYPLLHFCRHLRALDLGHSDMADISEIGHLTEMQALILADNPRITDISPLANLHELRYVELFMCFDIEDFSCFYEMPKMMDMNLSYCHNLEDIGFIDNMPDFHNGWFRDTPIREDDVAPYLESRQDICFLVGGPVNPSSIAYGWRSISRGQAIRGAFAHWEDVAEFRSWDDISYTRRWS